MHKTKLPAENRLVRLHNVNLALGALQKHGLCTSVTSAHIVEGARLQTLDLLWDVMYQLQVITQSFLFHSAGIFQSPPLQADTIIQKQDHLDLQCDIVTMRML